MDDLERIAAHLAKLKLRYDRKLSEAREELLKHQGSTTPEGMRFCPRCAYLLDEGVTVCFDCNLDLKKGKK